MSMTNAQVAMKLAAENINDWHSSTWPKIIGNAGTIKAWLDEQDENDRKAKSE